MSLITAPTPERFDLGKLRVVLAPLPWVNGVRATVAFRAGSAYEGEDNFGFSHFLEHLVFLSPISGQRPLEIVENLGGDLHGSTGRETTFFELEVDEEALAPGLDALARLAFAFDIDRDAFEQEKEMLALESFEDTNSDEMDNRAKELLWPDDSLFDDSLGDIELVRRARLEDLIVHHRSFYVPANALLVVAGTFDAARARAAITAAFAPFADRAGIQVDYAAPYEAQTALLSTHEDLDQDLAEILLAFRGYSYDHPHNLGAYVLAEVLAGAQTAMLYACLRDEHGISYTVESYVDSFLHAGSLSIYASCARADAPRLAKETLAALERLCASGDGGAELDRARRRLARELESNTYAPAVVTDLAVRRHLLGLPQTWWDPSAYRRELERITPATLQATARDLFRPERAALVVYARRAERLAASLEQTFAGGLGRLARR